MIYFETTNFRHSDPRHKDDANIRSRVAGIFRKTGIQSLLDMASRVPSGDEGFGSVIKLCKQMVEKLQKQAADEAAQNGWCNAELGDQNSAALF